jgi:hypothetical protein
MCLLGYKLIFACWAHTSAVQILSACGKRTKKDVPFGIKINIWLVGTYRPQSGMAEGRLGTQVPYSERHTNIIGLR